MANSLHHRQRNPADRHARDAGMNGQEERVSWALVTYLRSLRNLTPTEATQQQSIMNTAQYVGSRACERCHADDLSAVEAHTDGQRRSRPARTS